MAVAEDKREAYSEFMPVLKKTIKFMIFYNIHTGEIS